MSKRRPTPVEADDVLPPQTVIAEGTVEGRAVPWTAPTITKHGGIVMSDRTSRGRAYLRFNDWRTKVTQEAKQALKRRRLYGGPVMIEATYYLCPKGNLAVPDLDNLNKAFSDALQDAVIVNDSQVVANRTARVLTAEEPERVDFRVIAI